MTRMFILLLILFTTTACGTLHRSRSSGFADQYGQKSSSIETFYQEKKSHDLSKAKEEIGIAQSRTLTEIESARLLKHIRLRRLEQQIPSERERKQYYSFKPFMPNDADRVRFLQIPSYEGRQRWAITRGFIDRNTNYSPVTSKAIEAKDIIPGMNKKAVVESWGEPDLVEVSGNPMYENERWIYKSLISSDEGFENESRVIYFEFGRVAGWDRD